MKLEQSEFKLIARGLIFYTRIEGRISSEPIEDENVIFNIMPDCYIRFNEDRVRLDEVKNPIQEGIEWIRPYLEKHVYQSGLRPVVISIDSLNAVWVDF